MSSLHSFLKNKGYVRSKLRLTETKHLEIKVSINGRKGRFILDTGASSTCVGRETIEVFNLIVEGSEVKAAGAGATDMDTQLSKNNKIKIGKWKLSHLNLVLFDLIHINTALEAHNSQSVHGIIGADVLQKGEGIIDYSKKYLYLKQVRKYRKGTKKIFSVRRERK